MKNDFVSLPFGWAFLFCAVATTVCLGQDGRPFTIRGPEGIEVKFDRAKGIRKVEVGRAPPQPPAIRFEVLVEIESGGKKTTEWQSPGTENSQFFVDGPKVALDPGKKPDYNRNSSIALLGDHGIRIHAGSYGEFTNDPDARIILSQRGEGNLASFGFLISKHTKGAEAFLKAIGLQDREVVDLTMYYHSSKDQPMLLTAVLANYTPIIVYKVNEKVRAAPERRGTNLLIGRFLDPRKPDKDIDFTKPNPVSTLAELLEAHGARLLIGAQYVSANDLSDIKMPEGKKVGRGLTICGVFVKDASPKDKTLSGPAIQMTWANEKSEQLKVQWANPSNGEFMNLPSKQADSPDKPDETALPATPKDSKDESRQITKPVPANESVSPTVTDQEDQRQQTKPASDDKGLAKQPLLSIIVGAVALSVLITILAGWRYVKRK